MKKINLNSYSWVIRGKQRRDIIKYIDDPETPTEIANKSGYSLNHTSRILNEFRRKGLTKCLNPNQKTGRLYQLTEKGKIIRDKVIKKMI
jgi:DNA-binding MarR family transcriptional regulator